MVLKKQFVQIGNKVNSDVCVKVVLSTRRQLLLLILIELKWGRGRGGLKLFPLSLNSSSKRDNDASISKAVMSDIFRFSEAAPWKT